MPELGNSNAPVTKGAATNRFRAALLKLHLWAGLVTGIPLAIVGVSGSFLVFGGEIERLLNPRLNYVTGQGPRLPLQAIADRVRDASQEVVTAVSLPPQPNQAVVVMLQSRTYVYVNPYTGAILGSKSIEDTVQRRAFLIHTRMMAGPAGNWLVIISTGLTAFIVLTGIVLWWRRKIFMMRRTSSWKRMNFDLHNVLGLYAAPIVLVLALTGIVIAFEESAFVARLSNAPPPHSPPRSAPVENPATAPRITYDEAAAIGSRTLPEARITFIALPVAGDGPVSVYAKFKEDPGEPGKSRIFVDRHTGKVLLVKSTRDTTPTGRFLDLVEPIHFGDVFGMPSMIAVFIVGLFLTGQVLAGLLIWWNRRPGSARGAPRAATRDQAEGRI